MTGARTAIREATAADHERLDGLFERFDLADPANYGRFLRAHAAALIPAERALDAAGAASIIPGWTDRRRGALLRADLAALAVSEPPALPAPVLESEAGCWGAAYVLEGSRLGGAMLARRVGAGLPHAYLAAPQPKGAWRQFIAALDAFLDDEPRLALATTAARTTFQLFEAAGRQQLEHVDG